MIMISEMPQLRDTLLSVANALDIYERSRKARENR